jgi:hypothetical protein
MADKLEIIITAKDQASGVFGKMTNALGDVAKFATGMIVADVFGKLATGVSDFFTGSLSEAREAIANQKELAQVIKSTGGIAGVTAEEANSYAEALSKVTNFADDTILAGENMLLTFTNIGEDVFPRATKAMVDMGAKFGSVDQAAIRLGKALNDPIKGVGALSKIGVTFTEQQKEQIKAMVESGDIAKAQGVILAELERQVGGLAEAVADPAIQMQNAWAEAKEEVGTQVIPVMNRLAQMTLPMITKGVQFIIPYIEQFGSLLSVLVDYIIAVVEDGDYLNDWLTHFPEVLQPAIQNLGMFINYIIENGIPALQQLGAGITLISSIVLPLLSQAVQFVINNFNIIGPIIAAVGAIILALSSPLTAIIAAVVLLATAWANNWFGIQQRTQAALDFLRPYWTELTTIFNRFIELLLPELQKVWLELANVWTTSIKPALSQLWKSVQQLGQALGFSTGKTDFWKVALGILKFALSAVIGTVRNLTPIIRALGGVISFGVDNVRRFVDMLRSLKRSADSLMGVLRSVRDRIRDIINAAASMPDWLIPGSPTPFELGIRGIADAVKNLPTMELPGLTTPNLTMSPATVGGSVSNGGGGSIVVNLTYSPTVSMADKLEAETVLAPFIANGVRNYLAGKR